MAGSHEQHETEQVYQPAEDSYLLATTAIECVESDERVLDVGTGSGYVAATVREETDARVVGTDINPHACREARKRGSDVVRTDLVSGLCGPFDVVLFNPPYLPTDPDEERNDWMERALSGGPEGRTVIGQFLDSVGSVLITDSRVYLLASTRSGLDDVRAYAASNGFEAEIIAEDSIPFETLVVFEITMRH
jgi:release factor glutamine methyltransferase